MKQLILDAASMPMEERKVIRTGHHELTKGNSCLANLIAFCGDMTGWLDEGRAVDVAYLDLSRTSDNVSHNILIGKLSVV